MREQIAGIRDDLEAGVSREFLQTLLPPGGARNAVDCALWDLEAKCSRTDVWSIAGLAPLRPLVTTFTCGAAAPHQMAAMAAELESARALKLKLTGQDIDIDRIRAVRAKRPDVWLAVDANQGLSAAQLQKLLPVLLENNVALIEQPFPVDDDTSLQSGRSPIPIAADESVQSSRDLREIALRYDVINIKLDKCGGLTEALIMARQAKALGLGVMVGNMFGTSLAMAPACIVGQVCDIVDLDGPIFLTADRSSLPRYNNGCIEYPSELWGVKPN
jgi:L-Ala-D/L-Glu epimerase